MDDLDIRDRKGRLVRIGIAAALGLAITVAVMRLIASVSIEPNSDPVGSGSVGMLAIAVFAVTSLASLAGITAIARRVHRR